MSTVTTNMQVLPTHSDEQLSLSVRIIIWWLKIIGLAPSSLQHTNNSTRNSRNSSCTSNFIFSKIGFAYNILLSLLAACVAALALPETSSVSYPNKSSITQAIDVAQDIIRTSAICMIIVFGAFKQRKAISIMNRLLGVDYLLSSVTNHPPSKRTLLIFVAVQMIVDALLWVIFWASEELYVNSLLQWLIFNVPIFIMHWFVVKYAIVLRVVAMEFESLNKNLLNFQEFPNYSFRTPLLLNYSLPVLGSPTHCSRLTALELLHNIRTTLSEVSRDIADYFSLATLPVVATFSLTIVYNLWYLILPIVTSSTDFAMSSHINASAWILACIYPLILLSSNAVETLKEAQLTGLIIHKLLAKTRRQEIQTELERFSLHLMHEKLSFTAYGFFTLDLTLIQSIFGVTATYLVIIVQFMQSAANTSQNISS